MKSMNNSDNPAPEQPQANAERTVWPGIIAGLILILLLLAGYLVLQKTGAMSVIMDAEKFHDYIIGFGRAGMLVIIGSMAGAIVINPIPSAPIAIAAGLAYGTFIGTLLIVAGALLGALIAFFIGRLVGHKILYKWFGDKLDVGLLGSQNALMGIVFISRLLPFISFDIVSYAAGLTKIKVWRFALATFVGIIPISFLLAHLGNEMGSADMKRISVSILGIGLITSIPILIKLFVSKFRKKSKEK